MPLGEKPIYFIRTRGGELQREAEVYGKHKDGPPVYRASRETQPAVQEQTLTKVEFVTLS